MVVEHKLVLTRLHVHLLVAHHEAIELHGGGSTCLAVTIIAESELHLLTSILGEIGIDGLLESAERLTGSRHFNLHLLAEVGKRLARSHRFLREASTIVEEHAETSTLFHIVTIKGIESEFRTLAHREYWRNEIGLHRILLLVSRSLEVVSVIAELSRPSRLVATEGGEGLPILHSCRLHCLVFCAFKVLIEIESTSSLVTFIVDNHCTTVVGSEPLLGEECRKIFLSSDFFCKLHVLRKSCQFIRFTIFLGESLIGGIFCDGLVVISSEGVVLFLDVYSVMSLFQTFKLVVVVAASRGEGC